MTSLLNLAALVLMCGTLVFYLAFKTRSRFDKSGAHHCAAIHPAIRCHCIADTTGGSELGVRLFYALSAVFMVGMIAVYLTNRERQGACTPSRIGRRFIVVH